MQRRAHNEMVVGFFVIVGFVLLSLMVFFVSGVYFFRSGFSVNVMYDYVDILDKGAPVRMAGVRVGEVSEVKLLFDPTRTNTRVQVKLFIEKGAEIRENYAFEIRGAHILSEPHIEITPMPGDKPPLQDGATIEGTKLVPLEDLIQRAHHIAENLDAIVQRLHDALQDGETAEAIKSMILNLSKLAASFEKAGSGEDIGESLNNIHESTEALNTILTKIEKGEGTAGGFIMNDEVYKDVRDFVKDIKAHPWKLLKKGNEKKKKFLFF